MNFLQMKQTIVKIMKSQRWSCRVYEEYSVCYTNERKRERIKFLFCIPVAFLFYPFRIKSLKKYIDSDCIYSVKNNKNGLKVYVPDCDLDEMQKYYIMMDKIHDFDFLDDFTNKYLHDNMVILDIGGNIGNHSMYWAMNANPQKIHTFEPAPHTFEILKKNIEINGLENIVELHQCGCGASFGSAGVVLDEHNSGGTSLVLEKNEKGSCQVITVDSLELKQCDFIKIDVEGMEYDVLAGAYKTLQRCKPLLLMEIFDENFERVQSLLHSYGYDEEKYDRLTHRHDYLFVHKR